MGIALCMRIHALSFNQKRKEIKRRDRAGVIQALLTMESAVGEPAHHHLSWVNLSELISEEMLTGPTEPPPVLR
jgi:hypothetical protein